MTANSHLFPLALLAINLAFSSAADNCFWRSQKQINPINWFACNNTEVEEGGAQLCCIQGSQCGQDSICLKGVDYYVGGCTDGNYADPVCRTSCTDDSQTWIQYNSNTQAWECCGNNACDGSPPTETFSAIARASWSPIQSGPQSSSTPIRTSSSGSTTSTTSDGAASTQSSSLEDQSSSAPNNASSLSDGAKIGIGVACGLFGLAAILGIALFLLRRLKKRRAVTTVDAYQVETKPIPESPIASNGPSTSQKKLVPGGTSMHDQQAQELMSQPQTELPGEGTARAELEGGFGKTLR
ncbi:hypothetical protein Q7P37_005511 [Cladosporium fusiforme]